MRSEGRKDWFLPSLSFGVGDSAFSKGLHCIIL